jgi:hypothetical protein
MPAAAPASMWRTRATVDLPNATETSASPARRWKGFWAVPWD